MKVKSESEVAQSCPTLSDPMDCSLPGSAIHGIFQARVLEWGAIAFSIRINRVNKLEKIQISGNYTHTHTHTHYAMVRMLVPPKMHMLKTYTPW